MRPSSADVIGGIMSKGYTTIGACRSCVFGLAGGQSGHPGSRHYDDALGDWLRGRPRTLWMHWIDVSNLEEGVWELGAPSGAEANPAE